MGLFDRMLGKEKKEPKKLDLSQIQVVGGFALIPHRCPKCRAELEMHVPMLALESLVRGGGGGISYAKPGKCPNCGGTHDANEVIRNFVKSLR